MPCLCWQVNIFAGEIEYAADQYNDASGLKFSYTQLNFDLRRLRFRIYFQITLKVKMTHEFDPAI